MKSVLLIAAAALFGTAGCDQYGQKQTAQGSLQLPGQRPALGAGLNRPPDEWVTPAVTQAAYAD
jgi:hypothetical protein